jgi:hypothetical protein
MGNERFIRWQGYTMAQLSFAINLFLGLSTAALGFSVSLLTDEKFVLHGKIKLLFAAAMLSQFVSVAFGIAAVIVRTLDFRNTAQVARKSERGEESGEIVSLRRKVKRLGKATWFSFWTQVAAFALGVVSLVVSIFAAYSSKLL